MEKFIDLKALQEAYNSDNGETLIRELFVKLEAHNANDKEALEELRILKDIIVKAKADSTI